MAEADWHDLGSVDDLSKHALRQIVVGRTALALSCADGQFGVISGICNHKGGPLGDGRLDEDYVVCHWHYYKFHRLTGLGEPGYEEDKVPAYQTKIEGGHLWVDLASATKRNKGAHEKHKLERSPEVHTGPIRVLGISTTAMTQKNPRFSGSEHLLNVALKHATDIGAETQLLRLNDLRFRECEGYYSKSARACTWPCSITEMDAEDQMERVYEGLVHWADVVLVATPIRWGVASSLYFKMAERLNCVQNQITTRNRLLIRDKVASFIIVGGQDNVQSVAGQMLGFFSELGFLFPQFPYIAHSRGWSAEDMERNVEVVSSSPELAQGARALVDRTVTLAQYLRVHRELTKEELARGGRKAHRLRVLHERNDSEESTIES